MASTFPQDYTKVLLPPDQAAHTARIVVPLGAFTANTTVAKLAHIFDRAAVIREVWLAGDAVPSDPDGTMLVNVHVWDKSEAAFDSIVASFDCETSLTVAYQGAQATLVTETSENELTVAAGDGLRVQLVNNSAAITTNPSLVLVLLVQYIGPFPS
jgi:hypothetical protein